MQRLIESKSMLPGIHIDCTFNFLLHVYNYVIGRGCKTQAKQAEIAPEGMPTCYTLPCTLKCTLMLMHTILMQPCMMNHLTLIMKTHL